MAVYGIGPASALHRMGLRNGDALLRLDGVPVDGPDAAFEAFARFSNDRLLRITFEREGALREHLVRLQ